jgi:hypothetical protein
VVQDQDRDQEVSSVPLKGNRAGSRYVEEIAEQEQVQSTFPDRPGVKSLIDRGEIDSNKS